jgi:hypothetical protein
MKKNNHFPIENKVTNDCRKKIQEEKVIKFLKENRVILARLGYEIKKNYLKFLNDNYFFEIGYTKKESKLKNNKTINKWNIIAYIKNTTHKKI